MGVISAYCLVSISGFTGYSQDDNSRLGCWEPLLSQSVTEGNELGLEEHIAVTVQIYRPMCQGVHTI